MTLTCARGEEIRARSRRRTQDARGFLGDKRVVPPAVSPGGVTRWPGGLRVLSWTGRSKIGSLLPPAQGPPPPGGRGPVAGARIGGGAPGRPTTRARPSAGEGGIALFVAQPIGLGHDHDEFSRGSAAGQGAHFWEGEIWGGGGEESQGDLYIGKISSGAGRATGREGGHRTAANHEGMELGGETAPLRHKETERGEPGSKPCWGAQDAGYPTGGPRAGPPPPGRHAVSWGWSPHPGRGRGATPDIRPQRGRGPGGHPHPAHMGHTPASAPGGRVEQRATV